MSESLDQPIEVPELTADEIQARVLHRDGLMLVIDKPAGLPVHRGPKGGANLESSFDALRFGLPRPPVLAHRLDRDTSGCLVLGRHRKATASLGLLFKHGRISKTYWAVVEGGPVEDEGVIDLPLGRLNAERGWWQKPDPEGQSAVTKWKVLGRFFVTSPLVGEQKAASSRRLEERQGEALAMREAFGRGVSHKHRTRGDPPPQPSPARGEGAGSAT
jgi:tRNA pseudouridine32 synthase/23S rRNA pseudouridine746 synthase